MRKILIATAFSIFAYFSSSAQFNDPHTKCITFGLNGFSNVFLNPGVGHNGTILFRYFPTENLAYRFLFNFNSTSTNNVQDNSVGTKTTNSQTNNQYGLGFGIQRTFAKFGKFNAYAGADLVGSYTYFKTVNRSDFYKTSTGLDSGDYRETVNLNPAPYTIGIYPMLGISYFFSKNFSVGLEYNLNISYSLPAKGTSTFNQRVFGVDKPAVVTNTGTSTSTNIGFGNNVIVNVSFYF
jgi:hypothetical protein